MKRAFKAIPPHFNTNTSSFESKISMTLGFNLSGRLSMLMLIDDKLHLKGSFQPMMDEDVFLYRWSDRLNACPHKVLYHSFSSRSRSRIAPSFLLTDNNVLPLNDATYPFLSFSGVALLHEDVNPYWFTKMDSEVLAITRSVPLWWSLSWENLRNGRTAPHIWVYNFKASSWVRNLLLCCLFQSIHRWDVHG